MNQYVTGAVIKELREKYHLTQAEFAEKLNVSDKTVSKWETAKGYPEGNAEGRFKINGVKKILFYCKRDGLFFINIVKGIDDKETTYDDIKERRKLEETAKKLFR